MDKGLIPVLAVALITWGGVLIYMARVQAMLKSLERDVAALDTIDNSTPDAAPATTQSMRTNSPQ